MAHLVDDFPPLAPLELFLLRNATEIVAYLLHHVEIPHLFVLAKLNSRLRSWFESYRQEAWNFTKFAQLFVHRPTALLSMLNAKHTLIYGEAVLQFFLRGASKSRTHQLEICTTIDKFIELQRFLHDEAYMCLALQPVLEHWPANVQIGDLVRRRHRKSSMTWSLESDMSSRPEDIDGFCYTFQKGSLNNRRSVVVYVIRCEPHRHVLGRSNSEYTCCLGSVVLTVGLSSALDLFHGWRRSVLYVCE